MDFKYVYVLLKVKHARSFVDCLVDCFGHVVLAIC